MSELDHAKKVLDVRNKVINICWEYLYENFHKFTDSNKIKVGLAICTKNIPQQVDGVNPTQVVIMGEIKRADGSPMRYNLGSRDTSEVIATAAEAVSSN
jgi:hypothetical protein